MCSDRNNIRFTRGLMIVSKNMRKDVHSTVLLSLVRPLCIHEEKRAIFLIIL